MVHDNSSNLTYEEVLRQMETSFSNIGRIYVRDLLVLLNDSRNVPVSIMDLSNILTQMEQRGIAQIIERTTRSNYPFVFDYDLR